MASRWRGLVLMGVAAALVVGSGGGDMASPLLAARESATTTFELFDAGAEDHDWVNSYLLADLSLNAYLDSHDHRYPDDGPTTEGNFDVRFQEYAAGLGLEGDSVRYVSALDPANVVDTQVIMVENDDALFVVFRGTESPTLDVEGGEYGDFENLLDWITDAYAAPTGSDACFPVGPPNEVIDGIHCGFYNATRVVYEDVRAAAEAAIGPDTEGRSKSVWITGHSLGGALASVATWMLESDGIAVQGMTTFAQPRAFLDEVSQQFTAHMGTRAYRWVNNEDPVPHVPPPTVSWIGIDGLEYQHVGNAINILPDDNGDCQVTVGDDEMDLPGLRFSDHSMKLYGRRVLDNLPDDVLAADKKELLPTPAVEDDGQCPVGATRGGATVRLYAGETDPVFAGPVLDLRDEAPEGSSDWLGALLSVAGVDADGTVLVRLDEPDGLDVELRMRLMTNLATTLGFETIGTNVLDGKAVTASFEAEWPPDRDPAVPTIRLGLSSEATWTLSEVVSMLGLDLEELANGTSFDGFSAALQWDPDGDTWFDLTTSLTVGGLPFTALVSGNPTGDGPGQSLYALCSGETSLAGLLGEEMGAFAGDLVVPSTTLPMVLPEGTSMTVGDLRDGIPANFFAGPCALRTGSGTGGDEGGDDGGDRELLPDDFEITDTLSFAANLPVGQVDELRNVLGLAATDVVALTGRLGFTVSGFQAANVALHEVSLKADLPAVSVQGLPFWLTGVGTGPSSIGLDWRAADGDTPGSLELFARTALKAAFGDVEITFDPVELRYQDDGESLRIGVLAASGSDLLAPLDLSWLEMTGIGLAGEVGISEDDGASFDVELSSGVAFHVQNTDACPSGSEPTATVFLGLAMSDGTVTGRARVAMTDLPLGWMACVVATQFTDVDADVFGEFSEFSLSELTLAAEVASNGKVRFEAGMASTEFELLGLTLPAVRGYVLAEVDGDLTLVIGVRPEEDISLASLLGGDAEPDEDSALSSLVLPTSGIVASYGEYSVGKGNLTEDGRAFFDSLHGDAENYSVELVSGINLLSNIPLPDGRTFEELRDNLWLDPTGGIQFRGGLGIPFGPETEPKLSLELELPRISPPDELEWLTGGSMYLRLEVDTTPKLVVSLGGTMNTRWRRPDVPVGGTCTLGEVGVFEGVQYCYDHLNVEGSAAISLSAGGISFTLEAALVSDDEFGWRQPFGVEWLTIYEVRLLFGVTVPPSGSVNFTLGFRGAVAIGDGAPTSDVVIDLSAAFDIQVQSITAPPGFVLIPKPVGFRGYISTLPITDLARMGAAAFPDNLGNLSEVVEDAFEQLPHVEIRNAELMFGLQDFPSLCISTGFLLAGELWISADAFVADPNAPPPTPPDCGGSPIGPDSTVSLCPEEARSRGCFAAGVIDISLDGIVGKLSIGGVDLDPLVFDDTELTLILTLLEQSFVVSGGVTLDPLGAAQLALALRSQALPPAALADVYGKVEFGLTGGQPAFRAVVDGSAELATEVVPLGLDGDLSLFASLETEFGDLGGWGTANQQHLSDLAEATGKIQDRYRYLVDNFSGDPVKALRDVVGFLNDQGAPVPAWIPALIDHIEDANNGLASIGLDPATLLQILDGAALGRWEIVWWSFDRQNPCPDADLFGVVLLTNGTFKGWSLLGPRCEFDITLQPAPKVVRDAVSSASDALLKLETLYLALVNDALKAADLAVTTTLGGLQQTFDLLASSDPAFALECAQFGFTAGQEAATVDLTVVARINGQGPYGFKGSFNLSALTLDAFWDGLFGGFWNQASTDLSCRPPAEPPDGVAAVLPLDLQVKASARSIREGQQVTLNGTVSQPVSEDTDVLITWGDGETSTATVEEGGDSFAATHRYEDDAPPKGFPRATFSIVASLVDDPTVTARTAVVVRNVAPTVTIDLVDDDDHGLVAFRIDEGGMATLSFRVTDPGIRDAHTAVVDWGDGTVTDPFSITAGQWVPVSHVYLDDDPSFTAFDPVDVTITVTDDDTGVGAATATGWVHNVEPSIPQATLDAIADTWIEEGDEVSFTITFNDPGVLDNHLVRVDWGDDTEPDLVFVPAVLGRTADELIQVTLSHTWVDDDPTGTPSDPYTITIEVLDDDLGYTSETVEVIVRNVVPYDLELELDVDEIDELGTVHLSGSFEDPGVQDTFTVLIDWGHPALGTTTLDLDLDLGTAREFQASKQYGDTGVYTITVTVWDDDTPVVDGVGVHRVADSVAVTVHNVDPDVTIDDTDTVIPPSGIPTLIVRAGEELTLTATATDPGSDDLTFVFDWNDGAVTDAGTSYRSADGSPDPELSPDVAPRFGDDAATMTASHVFQVPCVYEVTVTVTDDDDGVGVATIPVVVTGTDHRVRGAGWWYNEMIGAEQRNSQGLTEEELLCRLAIAGHMSSVFHEVRDASSLDAASPIVLNTRNNGRRTISDELDNLDRHLLALWLNFAHGSVLWDQLYDTTGNRTPDTALVDLFFQAEDVRLDPTTSRAQVLEMAARVERVNTS